MNGDVPHKPGSPNWRKPATPKQTMFKPGTGGDADPDHLWATVTAEEAAERLEAVMQARHAAMGHRGVGSVHLYSEWERTFAESLATQLAEAQAVGRLRPFSGKQLVVLWSMYQKLANVTAATLARDERP